MDSAFERMESAAMPVEIAALEGGDPAHDHKAFRRALGQFATGVTVVTTECEGARAAVTANSFTSLSLDPPLILWSIAKTSRSYAIFSKTGHFVVHVLGAHQINVSQHFSSAVTDKFADIDWRRGVVGSPVLDGATAVFECTTEQCYEGGDHLILVGRVRHYARYAGEALLYAQGRYGVVEDHPVLRK